MRRRCRRVSAGRSLRRPTPRWRPAPTAFADLRSFKLEIDLQAADRRPGARRRAVAALAASRVLIGQAPPSSTRPPCRPRIHRGHLAALPVHVDPTEALSAGFTQLQVAIPVMKLTKGHAKIKPARIVTADLEARVFNDGTNRDIYVVYRTTDTAVIGSTSATTPPEVTHPHRAPASAGDGPGAAGTPSGRCAASSPHQHGRGCHGAAGSARGSPTPASASASSNAATPSVSRSRPAKGRHDLAAIDAGTTRHPTWGRKPLHRQALQPGYFSDVMSGPVAREPANHPRGARAGHARVRHHLTRRDAPMQTFIIRGKSYGPRTSSTCHSTTCGTSNARPASRSVSSMS